MHLYSESKATVVPLAERYVRNTGSDCGEPHVEDTTSLLCGVDSHSYVMEEKRLVGNEGSAFLDLYLELAGKDQGPSRLPSMSS